MEVDIGEIRSSIRVVDGEHVLSPQAMERIVRAVLEAVREEESHRSRVREEIGAGPPPRERWG
jgi:hypothetical protein